MSALDAVVRALYRLFYSRRNLLQWTTAATAQAQAQAGLAGLLRLHWQQPLISLALLALLFALGTPSPGLAVALEKMLILSIAETTIKDVATKGFVGMATAIAKIVLLKAAFGTAKASPAN